jgi:hypothetical protein
MTDTITERQPAPNDLEFEQRTVRTGGEPETRMPIDLTYPSADLAQARAVVHSAQLLYTFWNTGDTTFVDQAIAPGFKDNTLPPGHAQGPTGPTGASAAFRTAVPDLTCQLSDLYVSGDTCTAHSCSRGISPAPTSGYGVAARPLTSTSSTSSTSAPTPESPRTGTSKSTSPSSGKPA